MDDPSLRDFYFSEKSFFLLHSFSKSIWILYHCKWHRQDQVGAIATWLQYLGLHLCKDRTQLCRKKTAKILIVQRSTSHNSKQNINQKNLKEWKWSDFDIMKLKASTVHGKFVFPTKIVQAFISTLSYKNQIKCLSKI